MGEEELEEIRKKKQAEAEKGLEAKKAEEQLKTILRKILEEKAYDRMMNVAVANRQLYTIAAKQVLTIAGKIRRKITEEELLTLLRALKAQTEKETTIRFHKK